MPDEPGNLPAVPPAAGVAGVVIDGRVVEPRRLIPAPVRVVAGHPVAMVAGRHAGYVIAGAVVAVRRRHARKTRNEQVMRALQAAGNHDAMLAWRQQQAAEQKARAERRQAWIRIMIDVAKASPWILGGGLAVMAGLGLLTGISMDSLYGFAVPWIDAAHALRAALGLARVARTVATYAVPAGAILWLHHLGRHAGDLAPRWAVADKVEEEGRGLVVTADTIVVALQHMPITPLKAAFKSDWRPVFSLPPVREGKGYQASFSLPMGATPEMIADQVPILARNLHREPGEVWPTAGAPGEVSLYVVDRGAMERAAPEYPLMHEGTADVFKGVPGGVTARGDAMLIPVVANNWVAGGQQGQGKSNLCRVIILGCCLDPLCVVDVFVFAGNGDFDAYQRRLNIYRKGAADETVIAALDRLEWAYEEVGRREGRLAELGAKKLTRKLAAEHPDMRPVVMLFSECHELFGHPEHGERAAELAVKTIKRSRKTGIVFGFDTQSSRKGAIPPALVELVSVNACFYVKTWRSNDGFLGDGSFAAGIRATELRPGRDRGTSLVTGISDAQFDLLRWYFILVDDDTGYDAAYDVIRRAEACLAAGTPVGALMVEAPAIEAPRDLLTDLASVMKADAEPVRLSTLAVRLKDLAKSWQLTGTRLGELLDADGVRWTNTGNVPRLDPADLRRALARRDGELGGRDQRKLRGSGPGNLAT